MADHARESDRAGDSTASDADRVVILNPVSGSGEHVAEVRTMAETRGFTVRETEEAGDAFSFTTSAIERGTTVLAAAGGDGTLNEVVQGVDAADAFDQVTVGVIPVGTGNNFAKQIGIADAEAGVEALASGERRRIDLGVANDRVFVNSCVGGLTADASGKTTSELKNRIGVLAYVIATLRTLSSYDGYRLAIQATGPDGSEAAWSGNAMIVMAGNGRRFLARRRTQANMEDRLLDVTILENAPAGDLVGDALTDQLLGDPTSTITRLKSPSLRVSVIESEPMHFSLDGEMLSSTELILGTRANTLRIPVGDSYTPTPEEMSRR